MNKVNRIFLALWFFMACNPAKKPAATDVVYQPIALTYATGFTLEKAKDHYRVKVITPFKGATAPLTYVLYDRQGQKPAVQADAYIATPVKSIVCTSTTHIPLLDYLGESAALTGFPSLDYISTASVRTRIEAGQVAELGVDEALNIEKLVSLQPEVVMGYSLTGDFGQFNRIQEAGIPVLLNAEYLEQHPLGRAEWLKLAGILFNKETMADSVFNYIQNEYLQALALAKTAGEKPTVMSGIVYGGSWFVPGGRNYAARMLGDAGFTYLWQQDTTAAFLPLSFENVFNRAHEADFWIGVGSFRTLAELAAADSRYTAFRPYRQHTVYSYNKRIGAQGGSEFLELGYLRPDIILKDLIKIAHPNLLPEHKLFFHFQLP